jgi:hypothetical protein
MDGSVVKDVVTMGVALLGAVLGVMNTWNAMNQRRVRVRVTPHFALDMSRQPVGVSIELVNLSAFPVTIAEVGFECGAGRMALIQPQLLDHRTIPVRLEAREATSVLVTPRNFAVPPAKLGSAYARTACGEMIHGNSQAGRQFSDMMQDLTQEHAS